MRSNTVIKHHARRIPNRWFITSLIWKRNCQSLTMSAQLRCGSALGLLFLLGYNAYAGVAERRGPGGCIPNANGMVNVITQPTP